MICALCLSDVELRQSHIVPEFMYKAMYDEKHRFNVLTVLYGQKDRIEQKGIREALLCHSCEQKLSKWERYASLVFKGGAPGVDGDRKGDVVSVSGIDYSTFKLFLLSLLWRAGASHDPYFERVQLGPHQERLRDMLSAGDPGQFDQYPCIFFGLNWEPGETPGLMIQPHKGKVWGHTTHTFVLPGFQLTFFVSSQRLRHPHNRFPLQMNGSLQFLVRSPMDLPVLHEFMRKFDQQGRTALLEANSTFLTQEDEGSYDD